MTKYLKYTVVMVIVSSILTLQLIIKINNMFKIKENDLFSKNMSGSELYKTTKLSKKYIQKPAEIPGGMMLEMMKDVEDDIISKQEFDKWLNELIAKNGTTKY